MSPSSLALKIINMMNRKKKRIQTEWKSTSVVRADLPATPKTGQALRARRLVSNRMPLMGKMARCTHGTGRRPV